MARKFYPCTIDQYMFQKLTKLPIMYVLIMALLMLGIDSTGVAASISFTGQGYLSVGLFLFGLSIIAIGGYTFRKAKTTVNPSNPEKTTSLVTTGIYRFSRNPMYIGFLLWLLACAIYIGNVLNLPLLPIYIVLVNRLFIQPEEEALGKLFGEAFYQYKNTVRRWI